LHRVLLRRARLDPARAVAAGADDGCVKPPLMLTRVPDLGKNQ